MIGAVLIVGAGISGMQSALDLAEAGFKVYLVERSPAISGTMSMLDKTFPTNDCSMCILSPRVVDCGNHPNIEILTCSELVRLTGEAGSFQATVRKRPRYVDVNRCVSCGKCAQVCPQEVPNEFNQGLDQRPAIYKVYPQAYPNAYVIDKENCLECGSCREACPRQAIDLEMPIDMVTLSVGAVILSPGVEIFDPAKRGEFGYGIYPNVVTSLQFERMLSASGPYQGHPVRPSDHRAPHKIAFIQCVGSRDLALGHNWCSSVCCMHSTKEAIVAKEHLPGCETTVFCIDVRAYGKGFEQYYQQARQEYGVNYIKCMISSVKELQQTKNLRLRYRLADGRVKEEDYDLVVLAVGLQPPKGSRELAAAAGIELDAYGFSRPRDGNPVFTSRPGVFASGAFTGPKDIPETVIEAGAAAAYAARLLSGARGTLAVTKAFPPERDISREKPRIGVFVCHCGVNIGSVVDVPRVVQYAKQLKNVVHAEEFLFTCAQDSIAKIKTRIKARNLNRIVVAACTPRTHAPLFQSVLREAGLNPHLYEHVNIREHSSWVHREQPEAATRKAEELVKMAVARVRLLSPLTPSCGEVNPGALVVGGGAAGLSAALSLAEQGFKVFLVEKANALGGNLRHLHFSRNGLDPQAVLAELIRNVTAHPLIEVFLETQVKASAGYPGNYTTVLNVRGEGRTISHGATIIATGAKEAKPQEYLYGEDERVFTQREFEAKLADGESFSRVVMIQCVGSRTAERPACSRICCTQAVKNALQVKAENPQADVFILYRDVRTFGRNEDLYVRARRAGVIFIRYEPEAKPVVHRTENGLAVVVKDHVLNEELCLEAEALVLSTGVLPADDNEALSQLFKLPLTDDGFFLEAHLKLRPVDFPAGGFYLCGLAHGPKFLEEAVIQGNAAAMRAAILLGKERLERVAITAYVDQRRCTGCGTCVEVCDYQARQINEQIRKAEVIEALCQGCGACVAACPNRASRQKGFEKNQILAMIDAAG
ncbi:MAG: FAD-dependent oxidoreductase [Bacillota bacterium]